MFIESDTYLFWSTILKYVSTLDHTEPHILGHRTTHKADHEFMQGGAGYVLSHEALRMVQRYIEANHDSLDKFIEAEWAGDLALGSVFIEAGVPMTYSWPIFQPSFFGVVDFGREIDHRRYWCVKPKGAMVFLIGNCIWFPRNCCLRHADHPLGAILQGLFII